MLPLTYRPAETADLEAVRGMLTNLDLPLAGVEEALPGFVLALRDGHLVGLAGLEWYGAAVLLRSVGVHPSARLNGVAGALVRQLLDRAAAGGASGAYLLTTTAAAYFGRMGFEVVNREEVPVELRGSVEFREACPASATAMLRRLRDGRPA